MELSETAGPTPLGFRIARFILGLCQWQTMVWLVAVAFVFLLIASPEIAFSMIMTLAMFAMPLILLYRLTKINFIRFLWRVVSRSLTRNR